MPILRVEVETVPFYSVFPLYHTASLKGESKKKQQHSTACCLLPGVVPVTFTKLFGSSPIAQEVNIVSILEMRKLNRLRG